MYEENKVSVAGRIIWAIVSLLILGALVWLVLWLLFWRTPEPNSTAVSEDTTSDISKESNDKASSSTEQATDASSPSTPQNTSITPPATTSAGSAATGSTQSRAATTAPQVSSATTQIPSGQLANTGPMDAIIPVTIAVTGGAALYHVRLRRKVS